jgi:hypothetical protein
MLESVGQPVRNPAAFARLYADAVAQVIEEHKKERIPDSLKQIDNDEPSMAMNAPGRQRDYMG